MTKTKSMPREKGIEEGPYVLRKRYLYMLNRRKSFKLDVFETRLLGQKAICMGVGEATKLFYDPEKFIREGDMPKRVQKTLTGEKGVQSLGGEEHKNRKAMFMSLTSPKELDRLSAILEKHWENALGKWGESKKLYFTMKCRKCLAVWPVSGLEFPYQKIK